MYSITRCPMSTFLGPRATMLRLFSSGRKCGLSHELQEICECILASNSLPRYLSIILGTLLPGHVSIFKMRVCSSGVLGPTSFMKPDDKYQQGGVPGCTFPHPGFTLRLSRLRHIPCTRESPIEDLHAFREIRSSIILKQVLHGPNVAQRLIEWRQRAFCVQRYHFWHSNRKDTRLRECGPRHATGPPWRPGGLSCVRSGSTTPRTAYVRTGDCAIEKTPRRRAKGQAGSIELALGELSLLPT